MIKVLFVCLGNICRSPMAEYICRDLAARRGLTGQIAFSSAGTSYEEEGSNVYPPARRALKEMGIDAQGHRARRIEKADYARYDMLIGMETSNVRAMLRFFGGDSDHKISRMLDDAPRPRDIADPWYTGDFSTARDDIVEGCEILLAKLFTSSPSSRNRSRRAP